MQDLVLPPIPWKILEHYDMPGAFHMQFDEDLLQKVDAGIEPPTLRLYTWKPWCLTFGHFQKADQEIIPQQGLDCVRRPTGGRVVLHANEVTYTVCAPKQIAPWGQTLAETYHWIALNLQNAIALLGSQVELAQGETTEQPKNHMFQNAAKPPCFSSPSRSELVYQGRKLVGSAQRRSRNAFLQHGSLPLDDSYLRVVDYLKADETTKEAMRLELQVHSTSLLHVVGREESAERVIGAIKESFQGNFLH